MLYLSTILYSFTRVLGAIKESYKRMTTITNFLHCNFGEASQVETSEVPIWVLSGTRELRIAALRKYVIDNCVSTKK